MTFAVVSFIIAFLLIASGGLLIFYRDTNPGANLVRTVSARQQEVDVHHDRRDAPCDRRRG